MAIYKISGTAHLKINARTEMIFRSIIGSNIIDRILTPIQSIRKSNGYDVIYSQIKKIYEYSEDLSGLTIDRLDPTKMSLIAVKSMNSTTTVNNNVENIILSLEKSGYILIE